MPSRRQLIEMDAAEREAFLAESRYGVLGTLGPDGTPHLVNILYLPLDDGTFVMTSFKNAQKVVNVRRDARASLLVELTEKYHEFRGVMLQGRIQLEDRTEFVRDATLRLDERARRLATDERDLSPADPMNYIAKRIALVLTPQKVVSWDHRKLGGVY